MPLGRTHDRITLWCLPALILLARMFNVSIPLTIAMSLSFLVGGFMLGPDLDIHSIQYKRWGPLRWIWKPYQMLLSHRSRLSHGPIIGTAIRVLYLSLWFAGFALAAIGLYNTLGSEQISWQSFTSTLGYLLNRYFVEWLTVLIGLELGAMSHYVSDSVSSFLVKIKIIRPKTSRHKNRNKNRRQKNHS
jgi:uncharacterized metal-binding protein